MTYTKMDMFNDAANYNNRAFNYGFSVDHIPEKPVYAAREGEDVFVNILPFNNTPIEEIELLFDAVDFAIIEEIARSKYLSSLQIYQFVCLRNLTAKRHDIQNHLNMMMKLRVICEYEIKTSDAVSGLKAFGLDYKGFRIAIDRGVCFHKGNMYLSYKQKQELNQFDTAEDIKRILAGNMIALASLMNGVDLKRFGIMETMRLSQEYPVTDGCIMRTALNIQLDEESILLYEVVRSTPHAMRKLADKVNRYYTLINDSRYLEDNYYGYKAIPQLILCCESYEHSLKVNQYLRRRGLINERDTLLYTEDLYYVQATVQTLYELDTDGNRTWYSLPEQQTVTDTKKIA